MAENYKSNIEYSGSVERIRLSESIQLFSTDIMDPRTAMGCEETETLETPYNSDYQTSTAACVVIFLNPGPRTPRFSCSRPKLCSLLLNSMAYTVVEMKES